MRARVLGLGFTALACARAPAPLAPFPNASLRAPAAASQPPAAPAASSTRDAAATEPVSATPALPANAAEPSAQPPAVLIEPPYSALGHPRLATEMLTLGRDEELFQWALGGTSDPGHPSNRPGYHPATRVVVDVELLSRAPKGSTKRLERIARSTGYWPLRACFENAQRAAPKSERSARVRLTLGASGKVLGSRSVGPTPERDYARCVLERVRGLDFTPGFTRKLDVEISVRQWPGHAPVPPRAPDDAPAVRLSPAAAASLEGLTPSLTACYEGALAGDPKLWGRVALRLAVGADGTVTEATPVETQFPSAAVVECARQVLLSARLASPGLSELTLAVRYWAPPAPGAPPAPAPPSPVAGAPAEPAPAAPEH